MAGYGGWGLSSESEHTFRNAAEAGAPAASSLNTLSVDVHGLHQGGPLMHDRLRIERPVTRCSGQEAARDDGDYADNTAG